MVSHQVALVTGASSGIGRATAELLAASGFTVFGTSRSLGQDVRSYRWLPLDVRSDTSVEAAVQTLLEQAGRIDVLVNNAGYAQTGAIEESSIDDVRAQLDTNLLGALRVMKAVLPVMRQQRSGHIINVSSVVGHVAPPYMGVYATRKFALEGLTEALREEVRLFGVQVSLVEPGFVKTSIVSGQPTNTIDAYNAGRQATARFLTASVQNGMEPGVVAQAILRAITSRPRLRYLVGRSAKALTLLKRALPEPLFDRVRRRAFRVGKPAELESQTRTQEIVV